MIEVSYQITCDGCANDKCGQLEPVDGLGMNKEKLRKDLAKSGWRSYGSKDYCKACVKSGKLKARFSFLDEK
jgi:hypothetical protein